MLAELPCLVWALVTSSMLAVEPRIMPVHAVRRAVVDPRSGPTSPPATRGGSPYLSHWNVTRDTGFFTAAPADRVSLVWGDVPSGLVVNAFELGYATNAPYPLDIDVVFYSEENGWNSAGRVVESIFRLRGLPSGDPNRPEVNVGWIVTIPLDDPNDNRSFGLEGSDLEAQGANCVFPPGCDGAGLADFGYSLNFRNVADGHYAGPMLSAPDPNAAPCEAPGICCCSTWWDVFAVDPNAPPPEPNEPLFPGVNTTYILTGGPHAFLWSFHFALLTRAPDQRCPSFSPICAASDISPGPGLLLGGGDCVVDLGDLSVLLANFGTASGATFADGDIDPPLNLDTLAVGDGDVDLADLSRLLAAFGTDCR